jgi:hypothetical protein
VFSEVLKIRWYSLSGKYDAGATSTVASLWCGLKQGMHGMCGHAHAATVNQRQAPSTFRTEPEKFHSRRAFAKRGIEPQQEMRVSLGFAIKAEELAFVQVTKTSRTGRVRALRNHRASWWPGTEWSNELSLHPDATALTGLANGQNDVVDGGLGWKAFNRKVRKERPPRTQRQSGAFRVMQVIK